MLISVSAAALLLLLLFAYGLWKYQGQSDNITFNHHHVNPDIPPAANLEKRSSDTIEEIAEYAKGAVASHTPPAANPLQQAPAVAQVVQVVPEQPFVPQPPENPQQDSQVYEPPEPLQQRAAILDVENPIVQPPLEAIDVDIPDDISRPSEPTYDSEYGVRHSPDNPGRILRDKRYRRNAAND